MTVISAQQTGGIWGPVSSIPAGSLGILAVPSGYTIAAPADFYSASPPSVSNAITNVFNGSKTLTPDYFGLTYHRYPGGTTPIPETVFNFARSHDYGPGSRRVRWNKIEQTQGVFDWTALDNFVSTHKAAGRKVIHTLFGTPSWASARPSEVCSYENGAAAEPSNLTTWDSYCSACATRYQGQIDYYEIWNEPNLTGFYTGTQTILSQMTRRANQIIKAIDPEAQIICPAVTSLQSGTGQTYFTNMMAASDGASGNMSNWTDVVGVHLYPNNTGGIASISTFLSTFKASLSGLGLSGKSIFNTEFGVLSPIFQSHPRSLRTAMLARMMLLSATASNGVDTSIWYDADIDSTIGFTQEDVSNWNIIRNIFLSGPITVVNLLRDGRVAAVINNINYLF